MHVLERRREREKCFLSKTGFAARNQHRETTKVVFWFGLWSWDVLAVQGGGELRARTRLLAATATMRQGARMSETPKEGNEGSGTAKDFTTKAEYNRALVRQENWASAEEMRTASKSGVEFIKERQRKHTAQGLSRQQQAAAQMKKASESLEAHRQQNLTLGRAVNLEVGDWLVRAKAEKDKWSAYGKQVAASIKSAEDRGPVAAMTELSVKKKAIASATRKDDEAKAKAFEELKAAKAAEAAEKHARVKAETADQVTDQSKRIFYEQRLSQAQQTKTEQQQWEKERSAAKDKHATLQKTKREKVKAVKMGSTKSRQELITHRQAEAAALREEKRKLSEEHKAKMQVRYESLIRETSPLFGREGARAPRGG